MTYVGALRGGIGRGLEPAAMPSMGGLIEICA